MSILSATYFDGKRSIRRPVSIMLAGGMLKIVGRDVDERHDVRRVRRSLRIANTPRWLYLPGGGACVTRDNDTLDRWTRQMRYERALNRWEQRPAYAALAVLLVVAALWLLVDRGLPAAAEQVAGRIPVSAEAVLGEEALNGMDRYFMQPSKLPAARQEALRAGFGRMAGGGDYRLEFRASPAIGANAFALPSGIIVITDEMVTLARTDGELLGVLAHELGHVRHRHVMRQLLTGSATALVIAAVTGDITSATSLAASAPAVLVHTKYSRDHEREADLFAVELMGRSGIDPRHFAAILGRLEGKSRTGPGIPTFLSSHPASAERKALATAPRANPAP
jgi:Zn-dependent protease with chaperone function